MDALGDLCDMCDRKLVKVCVYTYVCIYVCAYVCVYIYSVLFVHLNVHVCALMVLCVYMLCSC